MSNLEKKAHQKFHVGDYVRWPIGVMVFSARACGEVKPIETQYSYGIIVDIARGTEDYTDVVIVYTGPNKSENWIVCHVDDDKYQFELVSSGDIPDE